MKRVLAVMLICIPVFAAGSGSVVTAQETKPRLRFETYGFEIAPLEVETKKAVTAYQSYLEPFGGFAAGVSVQVQFYAGNMGGYLAEARAEVEEQGWKMIAEDTLDNWPVMEYTGTSGNRHLHWYTRAFMKGPKLYVVTATGLEGRWSIEKEALVSAVNSFRLVD